MQSRSKAWQPCLTVRRAGKKLAGDKINSNQSEDLKLSCYRHINLLSERTLIRHLPFAIPASEYENRGFRIIVSSKSLVQMNIPENL
jgi:hypothetical protein